MLLMIASLQSNAQSISTSFLLQKVESDLNSGIPLKIICSKSEADKPESKTTKVDSFDLNGLLVNSRRYDKYDKLTDLWELVNDSKLKKILFFARAHYYSGGELLDTSLYSYDAKGRLTRLINRSGNKVHNTAYIFAEDDLPVEAQVIDENKKLIRLEKVDYFRSGNYMIITVNDLESSWRFNDTMKIDFRKPASIVARNIRNNKLPEDKSEYTYDSRGNWINRKWADDIFDMDTQKHQRIRYEETRQIIYQ